MNSKFTLFALFFIMTCVFSTTYGWSCKSPRHGPPGIGVGITGPTGPIGPAGATGATGPQGATGSSTGISNSFANYFTSRSQAITPVTPITFDQLGPSSGSDITPANLPPPPFSVIKLNPGTYRITYSVQISITDGSAAFVPRSNGVPVAEGILQPPISIPPSGIWSSTTFILSIGVSGNLDIVTDRGQITIAPSSGGSPAVEITIVKLGS